MFLYLCDFNIYLLTQLKYISLNQKQMIRLLEKAIFFARKAISSYVEILYIGTRLYKSFKYSDYNIMQTEHNNICEYYNYQS